MLLLSWWVLVGMFCVGELRGCEDMLAVVEVQCSVSTLALSGLACSVHCISCSNMLDASICLC